MEYVVPPRNPSFSGRATAREPVRLTKGRGDEHELFAIAGMLVLFSGPAHADVLPKGMLGLWAFEPADCSNPRSDGLLKIGSNEVRFFASHYDVKRVVRRSDGSVRATGIVSNEGEQGRGPGSLTLKLTAPDRLLALDHSYHRCH